jgi:long-chain acyl-CoA synthetase
MLILHSNFVGCLAQMEDTIVSSEDVMISYLPLAHCFERVLEIAVTNCGGAIGYYRGDGKHHFTIDLL